MTTRRTRQGGDPASSVPRGAVLQEGGEDAVPLAEPNQGAVQRHRVAVDLLKGQRRKRGRAKQAQNQVDLLPGCENIALEEGLGIPEQKLGGGAAITKKKKGRRWLRRITPKEGHRRRDASFCHEKR